MTVWKISALCSMEASVWVRFLELGDFHLRLYSVQTPATSICQTPRMHVLCTYWMPGLEGKSSGEEEGIVLHASRGGAGLRERGRARGGLQAGPRDPEEAGRGRAPAQGQWVTAKRLNGVEGRWC